MGFPRVRGVVTQQGRDISALCNTQADAYGCPPRLIVAQALAESGLDEFNPDSGVWPTGSARWGAWPDVSFGLWHQTVAFAPIGDHSATPENIAYVRQVLTTNLALAAAIAAEQLGPAWAQTQDGREAMSRYNAPSLAWAENPNRAHIAEVWQRSAAYIIQEGSMAEFVAGFAKLAESLGAEFVGEPLADEYVIGPTTRQPTTKGEMIWTDGGDSLFLPGVTA